MHELIAPSVNLVILVSLLVYFTRKPIRDMVAQRRTLIQTQLEEARALKSSAENKYKEFTEKLNAFETEAVQILERSRQEGDALKNKIIKEAYATAERIKREAEATAAANTQDYKDQIRRETIAKAVATAEQLIRERLSSDDQRRIVNEYVGKVQ